MRRLQFLPKPGGKSESERERERERARERERESKRERERERRVPSPTRPFPAGLVKERENRQDKHVVTSSPRLQEGAPNVEKHQL